MKIILRMEITFERFGRSNLFIQYFQFLLTFNELKRDTQRLLSGFQITIFLKDPPELQI